MKIENGMFLKFENEDPNTIQASAGEGSIEIVAAEKGEDGKVTKKASFKIKAYNGGPMFVDGFFQPIVLDLAGMSVTGKSRPILLNHDPKTPVGHSTEVTIEAKRVLVDGVFSFDNDRTREIIGAAKDGFPWQASVGARVDNILRVAEGESVQVNGKTFKGPLLVARKSTLKETSFVPLGADDTTSVKVAANEVAKQLEMEFTMKFEQWAKACGHDITKLGEAELKVLKATHASIVKAEEAKKTEDAKKPATVTAGASDEVFDIDSYKADIKAAASEAIIEANKIAKVCEKHPEIHAEAIANNWSEDQAKDKVELTEIRAQRDSGSFNVHMKNTTDVKASTIEAAIMQAGGMSEEQIIKDCGQETLEAADGAYKGQISLQELFVIAARANGYTGNHSFNRDQRAIFEAAMGRNVNASFSTLSLPGILSNAGNKFFKGGFDNVESTWRRVSAIGRANDFKQMTSYALTADMNYKKLAPGGEIEHGKVGEETYTNQVETWARMFGINRTDIINDDLGALTRVPGKLGRGAALAFNLEFWTKFLNNSAFFTVARGNLTQGQALGISELTAMETAFYDQTDPDGDPYGAIPGIHLVPNALNTLASSLQRDTNIVIAGGTDQEKTSGNPHQGKFEVVRSSYLSNANIPGNSVTASYLLSDVQQGGMATIETLFLNGQETPTVETADADFNQLGVNMRGYHDFGIELQEYREGVKSDGA
jgi:hypothetical protein